MLRNGRHNARRQRGRPQQRGGGNGASGRWCPRGCGERRSARRRSRGRRGRGGGATAGSLNEGSGGGGGTLASAGNGGSAGSAFPPGVTRPRIMIVGDSISAGPGCYKKYLLQNLTQNGYSDFEFVGQYTDDCGGGVRHSAVSCSTAEQYTSATFTMPNCSQGTSFPGMSTLAAVHTPDLVMLQLGVNDVWNGRATSAILASYTTLVEQARAQNPRVVLVVAQIHKIRPDCSASGTITNAAAALVNAVPAWAAGLDAVESRVFTADLWTNSDWSMAETSDCVHPNDAGAQKMALNWYEALKTILPKG